MNIIFGTHEANKVADKHIVLELDTVRIGTNPPMTVYAVIESLPVADWKTLDNYKKLHSDLLIEYKNKNWNYVEQAIEVLQGHWNGEIDSFYTELHNRVNKLKEQILDESWDGIIQK